MVVDNTLDDDTFGASGGDIKMVQNMSRKSKSEQACSVESMSSGYPSMPLSETRNNIDEASIMKAKSKKMVCQ